MLVEPGYKSGDIVKYDMHFWRADDVSHFRETNLYRRELNIIEVDPRDDHFMVMANTYRDITWVKKDNQRKLLNEQFSLVSPLKDKPNHKAFCESFYRGLMLSFPSYHFKPVDDSNIDLMARYVSFAHSCPHCEKKVSGHTLGNQLYFQCRYNDDGHTYLYRQFPNGDHTARFVLDGHRAEFNSTTKLYTIDGHIRNNIIHDKIYENIIEIMDRFKLYF